MKIYLQDFINGPLRLEDASWMSPDNIKPVVLEPGPFSPNVLVQTTKTYLHYRFTPEGVPVYLLEDSHNAMMQELMKPNHEWRKAYLSNDLIK